MVNCGAVCGAVSGAPAVTARGRRRGFRRLDVLKLFNSLKALVLKIVRSFGKRSKFSKSSNARSSKASEFLDGRVGSARWHAGTLSARAGASAGLRRTRAASMLVLAPPAILPVRASLNTCVHAAGDSSTAPANLPLKVLKLFEKCSKFRKVSKVFTNGSVALIL